MGSIDGRIPSHLANTTLWIINRHLVTGFPSITVYAHMPQSESRISGIQMNQLTPAPINKEETELTLKHLIKLNTALQHRGLAVTKTPVCLSERLLELSSQNAHRHKLYSCPCISLGIGNESRIQSHQFSCIRSKRCMQ